MCSGLLWGTVHLPRILNHKIQCSGHSEALQLSFPVERPLDLIGLGLKADTLIPPLEPSVPFAG